MQSNQTLPSSPKGGGSNSVSPTLTRTIDLKTTHACAYRHRHLRRLQCNLGGFGEGIRPRGVDRPTFTGTANISNREEQSLPKNTCLIQLPRSNPYFDPNATQSTTVAATRCRLGFRRGCPRCKTHAKVQLRRPNPPPTPDSRHRHRHRHRPAAGARTAPGRPLR